MKIVLALALALSSSVIGAVVGRSRRPAGHIKMSWAIVVAVVAAALAEGSTVLWVGAPAGPLQPITGGLLIGLTAGFFSGGRPPGKSEKK
ncbi:MAG: hypothetical protein M0Z53_12350 [Thermaerobacter sp.]|nr:hypothetical protein [Thermaerobacter sp.]